MTPAPNDAPRPTSELVKEINDHIGHMWSDRTFVQSEKVRGIMREAAAALQALEARNKELEGALSILMDVCLGQTRRMDDWGKVHHELDGALENASAALHPATKTGET